VDLFRDQKVKGQGHTVNAQYLPNWKAYKLQTQYTDGVRRPASSTSAVTSKVKGQGRKATWRVWQVLADKSRMKRPRKTKVGRKVVHPTGNNAYQFQDQRLRSSGRLLLRPEVRHIFRMGKPMNFKLGTQTEHEDPYHRQAPWPPRSKVKVPRSRGPYVNCWPISKERKFPERPKLAGRLPTPREIMRLLIFLV